MTLSLKHLFTSGKADGTDVTLVKPSNWNAEHNIQTDSSVPVVLGATTPGPVHDIPISTIMPTGLIAPFAGATAPAGWYLCDGSPKNRISDAALFAVIGTTYGTGDGSTTFNLPDLRGTAPVGKSNMGGSDRGNLPGGATLGSYLGAPSVFVNFSSYAVNNINFGSPGFVQTSGVITTAGIYGVAFGGSGNLSYINDQVAVTGYTTINANFGISVNGGGMTTPIIQPSIVLNMIIKT